MEITKIPKIVQNVGPKDSKCVAEKWCNAAVDVDTDA